MSALKIWDGTKWVAVGGGGASGGTVLLKKIVLSADAPTVSFTAADIPTSGYDRLELAIVGKTTAAANSSNINAAFNGDVNAANYLSFFQFATSGQNASRFITTLSGATASQISACKILFPDYRGVSPKSTLGDVSYGGNGGRVGQQSLMWATAAAINTLDLSPADGSSFAAGTIFALYGVSNAPVNAPLVVLKAGTGITIDNTDPAHPIISLATADTPPVTASVQDDEFNDAVGMSGPVNGLNAKWLRKNMDPTWSSLASNAFNFNIPTAQSATEAIYEAAPSGDFRISAAASLVAAGDRQMWGLFIVDAAGTGLALMLDDPTGDGATRFRTPVAWAGATAIGAVVSSSMNNNWKAGQKIYMSLRKSGDSYFGAVWNQANVIAEYSVETGVVPTTFVPAYVGFGRLFGASTSQVKLDWFRASVS